MGEAWADKQISRGARGKESIETELLAIDDEDDAAPRTLASVTEEPEPKSATGKMRRPISAWRPRASRGVRSFESGHRVLSCSTRCASVGQIATSGRSGVAA